MARTALTAIMAFLLTAGMAFAADKDKEVKGTIVKVDVAKKKITLKTVEGEKVYDVSAETKFIGPKGGKSDEGIKDSRLTKGAAVTAKVAANNKTLHELHLPTTVVADPKTAAPKKTTEAPKKTAETPKKTAETPKKTADTTKKPVPAKTTEAPKATASTKTAAPKKTTEAPKVADATGAKTPPKTAAPAKTDKPAEKKVEKKIPDGAVIGKTAADAPGTKAKIVKVDAEKKTLLVTTEDGKSMEVQASDDTKFIGPRGGISQERLKDDRLAVGYEVRLVMGTGKAVKEVHMSYRKRKPTDK